MGIKRNRILLFLIMSGFLTIFVSIYYYYTSQTEQTIFVKHKERIAESNGGAYLIFTPNEVFEDCDSYLFLKFNSSDIYNMLEKGKYYRVKVVGWRIPFLSMYRNIINVRMKNAESRIFYKRGKGN